MYVHGVSHAAVDVRSHVRSSLLPSLLLFSSLSLSLSLFTIFTSASVIHPSEVNLGATTRSYYRVGWALIPIFQSTYRARPTPHGLSKASRGLTRVKGKINKPAQKPGSLSFSLLLPPPSPSLFSLCLCVKRTGICVDTDTCLPSVQGACASVWRAWRHLADCPEIDQENWTNGGASHKRPFFLPKNTFCYDFFGVEKRRCYSMHLRLWRLFLHFHIENNVLHFYTKTGLHCFLNNSIKAFYEYRESRMYFKHFYI